MAKGKVKTQVTKRKGGKRQLGLAVKRAAAKTARKGY